MGYFAEHVDEFQLGKFGEAPLRDAQIGALHSVIAHFTVHDDPAIVALPTGVGKTAVASALPFALPATGRVLVIEPSIVLRKQAADEFRTLNRLKLVNVVPADLAPPVVLEQSSGRADLDEVAEADVVVAHPNSLRSGDDYTFPAGFFSLVIFDEGHHLAAPTWTVLLQHFEGATVVALTATPFRRDRRRVPGRLVYDYPLPLAVELGAYKPVTMIPVPNAGLLDAAAQDLAIRDAVVDRFRHEVHDGSGILVRADKTKRAEELARLYSDVGISLAVVHSRLAPKTVENRLRKVADGEYDGAAFVGILWEGFDCPRLKVGAYHDKHKSLPATLQFIGRLTRPSTQTNGPAEVVTTYELIKGDTWELFRHDAVWERIIPRLVANATEDVRQRGQLFAELPEIELGDLTANDILVRREAAIFEVEPPTANDEDWWDDPFSEERLAADGLVIDERFAGGQIVWTGSLPAEPAGAPFLALITSHITRPQWVTTPDLDAATYELHTATAVTTRESVRLLLVGSNTRPNERRLAAQLTQDDRPRRASAQLTGSYLNQVNYDRIHALGQRSSTAGAGSLSYAMLAGKSVDTAITELDAQGRTLGHVMGGATLPDHRESTVGASPDNGRIWDNSVCHLNEYVEWATWLADILTEQGLDGIARLPAVATPESFDGWPAAAPILVEPDSSFYERVQVANGLHPADIEFSATHSEAADGHLRLTCHGPDGLLLDVELSPDGVMLAPDHDTSLLTSDGVSSLSEELREAPPMLFFADQSRVRGRSINRQRTRARAPRRELFQHWDWQGVDITAEARDARQGRKALRK
jgi:superfamily II DNA or RNA helicase